jgi:hypothetical protein
METVLKGLSWSTCLVYLDDIIVVGKSFEDHLKNLEEVLKRLKQSGLTLSSKKCHLFQKEVQYLGHVVSDKGVAVDQHKVKAVQEWPVPNNLHELRSFLGLCTYYRRYVPGFASIAKPLTRLTEGQRRFCWDQECQESFRKLKNALTNAPVLGYPLPEGQFILDTDASNVGLGAVLSQNQGYWLLQQNTIQARAKLLRHSKGAAGSNQRGRTFLQVPLWKKVFAKNRPRRFEMALAI